MNDLIKIKQLNEDFFAQNAHLTQVLHDKNRGYGVILVKIYDLTFGIPLHSGIRKRKDGFITGLSRDNRFKGLNYSKALIISDNDIGRSFKIPWEEFMLIRNHQEQIIDKFSKYVKRYIQAVRADNKFILKDYEFSTLVNYHLELRLDE